jgi:hypothetical protein
MSTRRQANEFSISGARREGKTGEVVRAISRICSLWEAVATKPWGVDKTKTSVENLLC